MKQRGFTLIEMGVAIFVLALVLGSIIVPLGTQVEQRQISETQRYIEEIKEALMGFAATNGRLPCPASNTSNGVESYGGTVGASACTNPYDGFVPAVTLGISPVDSQGFAVDPWGNRLRYAVTTYTPAAAPNPAFTSTDGMKSYLSNVTNFSSSSFFLLVVCSTATGITASDCGATSDRLTKIAPAVVYSVGRNSATGGTGIDEAANPNANSTNNDRVFVSHAPTPTAAANGEFDDIVSWLAPTILFNRMIAAGKLP